MLRSGREGQRQSWRGHHFGGSPAQNSTNLMEGTWLGAGDGPLEGGLRAGTSKNCPADHEEPGHSRYLPTSRVTAAPPPPRKIRWRGMR